MSRREQLIAAAESVLFNEGAVPLDLHFEMLGEGLDAETIEHQLKDELEII